MNKILDKYRALSIQAKASLWFLICAFLQKGIASLTTFIFTRLMSQEEFGKFGVFCSWMGIISIFVTLNLYYGVYSQGLVKFKEERSVFSSTMEGLVLTLCLAYTLVYLLFHRFFNGLFHLTTIQMLALLTMTWTSAVFNFWAEEQRVEFKYKAIIAISLVMSIIKPLLCVILVVCSEDKVTARILGLAMVDIICCSVLFVVHFRRGATFFSKKYWLYALGFNLPLIPHYLSATVLSSADRIMIEDMTGSGNAGIYNLAYSVALIMTMLNSSLMQTLSPWIYQKIKDNCIRDIEKIAYTTLILVGAANITLILFAPEVVRIVAPSEYAGAVWAIPPVIMSVYFMFSYDLFAKFAFYHEKTFFIMIASVIGAALNVLLNYLLIPVFGFIAAAYTTLLCYMIYSVAHYLFMRKVCRECCNGVMPYKTKILFMITAAFMLLGFAFMATYLNTWIRYGIVMVFAVVCVIFRDRIKKSVASVITVRKKQ